jgi:MtN3 and saliva related transmembrane protein
LNTLLIDAVGVAAAVCSMVSFVPQIIKLLREQDASAVSLRMYLVTVVGFALWTTYGVLLGQWPLIASNLVNLSLAVFIVVLKLYFSSRRPQDSRGRGARP